jgi:hypothetical protein
MAAEKQREREREKDSPQRHTTNNLLPTTRPYLLKFPKLPKIALLPSIMSLWRTFHIQTIAYTM